MFGSLFGTPIINPPQSAILGMHGSFERPVVRNGQVSLSSERVFENLFTYFWEMFRYYGFLVNLELSCVIRLLSRKGLQFLGMTSHSSSLQCVNHDVVRVLGSEMQLIVLS